MQADQQQDHQREREAWRVTIRARAHRKFDFTVKARIISATGIFQNFSILLRLYSFNFRLNLEPEPAIRNPGKILKSNFIEFFKKSRICSWVKKTSAPKKDVVVPANPLKRLAFRKTENISPCWPALMGGCVAAAVCWVSFHQVQYMNFESASISRYVSEAFQFAGSIANEILCNSFKW